jgi:PAS domain S-box-containing protein
MPDAVQEVPSAHTPGGEEGREGAMPAAAAAVREAAGKSEERYRLLFVRNPQAMWVFDLETLRFLAVNAAALRDYGYSEEEFLGLTIEDIRPPQDVARLTGAVATLSDSPRMQKVWRHQRKDGTIIDVEISSEAIVFDGRPARLVLATDITARLRAEERYRRSEEMLQGIFNASRDGILVESDGHVVYINQSYLQLLGYERSEDLIGGDISRFVSPDVCEKLTEFGRRRLRGEEAPTLYQFSVKRRDGTAVDVEGAVSVSTVNGKQYITTAVRDITDRKRAEDDLRKSEQEHRELAGHLERERARLAEAQALAKVGSWELDLRTDTLWWSNENYRVFGMDPNEFGASYEAFLECVHPDDRKRVDRAYTDSVSNKTPYSIDHSLLMKDGQIKIVNESCQTFYDDDERAIRSVGTTQDITERKLAELALRESAKEFRMLSEAMPQIVWMTRPDGWNIYSNKRWVDFTGLTVEESYGLGWSTVFHPDDRQRSEQMWKRAVETSGTFEVESRMRKADGSYHWMLIRGLPLRDSSGTIIKWMGTCTDIDEMKQAMEAIRVSEDRFKLFANVTNDAIWDWNLITSETWRNEGYSGLFGYTAEEVGADFDWWSRHIAPEDRDRVLDSLGSVERGEASRWSDEYNFLRRDGSRAYILDRGYVIRDDAGKPVRMIGGMTDLSERHSAEERLGQQAALIDDARDAMIVKDLDDTILFWSKGAERIYGWRSEDVLGLRSNQLFHLEAEEFDAAVQTVLATGEWTAELRRITASGATLTVESHWKLLRDHQGRPKSIFTIDTDITERKKLEQQFLRSQRMESVGTLAGGIAHDLNNLLMPILMGVSLLRRFETSEKSVKVIQNIELSAKRAAELVKQVLSFARGEEGSRVAVHLGDIVREVAAIVENTFPKNIAFEARISPDLRSVAGDPTQISQVLLNLCLNSRDAMPDGGTLRVLADNVQIREEDAVASPGVALGNYVVLTVADDGFGMTKEVVDRIFEPFFTTKELGQGTGLGLSTTLGIVRSHGGLVNIVTEPGKGTTFRVYFPPRPEMTAATERQPTEAAQPRHGHGELILVVDDEAAVLTITRQTLETFGYRVLTAAGGEEALACYRAEGKRIAMVLTDMMMPGMSGSELIEKLRLIDPDAVIVAVTGLDNKGNVARARSAGASRLLAKPYAAELLLGTLFEALQNRRSETVTV